LGNFHDARIERNSTISFSGWRETKCGWKRKLPSSKLKCVHEVTNVGSDRNQLSSMAKQAREVMASDTLSVVGNARAAR
jgi:hypothetical protein